MTYTLNPFERLPDVAYAPIGSGFAVTLGKMLDAGRELDPSARVLPYVRAGNIQDVGLDLADVNTMPFSDAEAAALDLRRNDILVVEGGAVGTCVVLEEDLPGWSFQKTVNRLRPTGEWSSRFVAYVLRAYRDAGVIDIVCNKSTIPHLTAEKLRALRVPVLEPRIQESIADYLDHETAQIDELISAQQRLIDLLVERRLAVAAGVLGGRVGTGDRLKWLIAENDVRGGDLAAVLPLLSVSISWGVRRRDEVSEGETRAEDLSNYKLCSKGDLVINRMRAFQGALGLAPEDGVVSPDYAVLKISPNIDAGWLIAAMKTSAFVAQMAQRVKGIGSAELGNARTPRINISDLGEIRLEVPNRAEQASERDEVESQIERIDALVVEAERFIELASERRAALITAAVTGQVDVRKVA